MEIERKGFYVHLISCWMNKAAKNHRGHSRDINHEKQHLVPHNQVEFTQQGPYI